MTSPPIGGLVGSSGPAAPVNPDGTPNIGVLSGGVPSSGQTTIWNIPADIQGKRIWYDVNHIAAPNQTLVPGPGGIMIPRETPGTHAHSKQNLMTPTQVFSTIAAMSYTDPGQFLAIQKALAEGNFGTVNPSGMFDAQTESALGQALTQWYKLSHLGGVAVDFQQYLLDSASRGKALDPSGSGSGSTTAPTPPTYRVTDPTAIRSAAQSAFESAVGKAATPKQLDAFVAQFQQAQKTYESTQPGQTGTSPELGSQAAAFAQQSDPNAYQNYQHMSYANELVNLLMSGSAQRPTPTPTPTVTGS